MAEQTKILVDTAIYLNNQIKLGQVNNSIFNKQMSQNSDSIKTNSVPSDSMPHKIGNCID